MQESIQQQSNEVRLKGREGGPCWDSSGNLKFKHATAFARQQPHLAVPHIRTPPGHGFWSSYGKVGL